MKRAIFILSSLLLLAWGCSKDPLSPDTPDNQNSSETDETETTINENSSTNDSSDLISGTTFGRTITITYSAAGATKSGDDNR